MSDIFEIVAQTISEECNIPRDSITLDSNVAEDFGLDSLSFIDVCHAKARPSSALFALEK